MTSTDRDLTLKEVLELLSIRRSRLTTYLNELGDQLPLAKSGKRILFSAQAVEKLRSWHEQRKPETGPFPGLTTAEVARSLDLPPSAVVRYAADLRNKLKLRKFNRRLVFTQEAVEEIRRYCEFRRDSAGYRTTHEAEVLAEAKQEVAAVLQLAAILQRRIKAAAQMLEPLRYSATGFIHSLPDHRFHPFMPIAVMLTAVGRNAWLASFPEARLQAEGYTREEALRRLRGLISRTFAELLSEPLKDPDVLAALSNLIRVRPSRK